MGKVNFIHELTTNIWYVGDWHSERYEKYNQDVKLFEKRLSCWYPIGDDLFRIDHGPNYFNFFRRLGELFFYIAMNDQGNVIGTIACVRQKVGGKSTFYLCDLKIDPQEREKGHLRRLMWRALPACALRCQRFYAISMNDGGENNRVSAMSEHVIGAKNGGVLNIYCLEAKDMRRVVDQVTCFKGVKEKARFLALFNVKDLVLKSTGKRMRVVHLCTGANEPWGMVYDGVQDGFLHMFCTRGDSALSHGLGTMGIEPFGDATIIHYGMEGVDWEFLETSAI